MPEPRAKMASKNAAETTLNAGWQIKCCKAIPNINRTSVDSSPVL